MGEGLATQRATGSPGEKGIALDQTYLLLILKILMKATGPSPRKNAHT